MHRFALVPRSGGIVTNVIVGHDHESVSAVVGDCVQETTSTGVADYGYAWDGSTFIAPPSPDHIWNGTEWTLVEPAIAPQ